MNPIDPGEVVPADALGRVHFIAIGGAGMSGVARIMLRRGMAAPIQLQNEDGFFPGSAKTREAFEPFADQYW